MFQVEFNTCATLKYSETFILWFPHLNLNAFTIVRFLLQGKNKDKAGISE